MTDSKHIALDEDLDSIIKAKTQYHEDQIKFHKERLQEIKNYYKSVAPKEDTQEPNLDDMYNASFWKGGALRALASKTNPIKSEEIYDIIDDSYKFPAELRRTYMARLSAALSYLCATGNVLKIDDDGKRGYLYKRNVRGSGTIQTHSTAVANLTVMPNEISSNTSTFDSIFNL